tara:strand:- start:196 stop:453 length:258 start_codon:yes stop_codon:yes gene_type:complete
MKSFLTNKEGLEKKIKQVRELQKKSKGLISHFEKELEKKKAVDYNSDFLNLIESINKRELLCHKQEFKTYQTKEKKLLKDLTNYK